MHSLRLSKIVFEGNCGFENRNFLFWRRKHDEYINKE